MNSIKRCIFLAFALCVASTASIAAAQYTLTTLANFNGTNGAFPHSDLIMDASGNLFGTTAGFNVNGLYGSVFEVAAKTRALSALVTFDGSNGSEPYGGVTADGKGNLYGTTSGLGKNVNGTVFRVTVNTRTFSTIATFNNTNGARPLASLLADASGNLYGTTELGGPLVNGSGNHGTVFEIAAGTNAFSTLATFNGLNGSGPAAGLIADVAGNFYGTTEEGGDLTLNGKNGYGTVFKMAAGTHAITTLAIFNGANGGLPLGRLVADSQGNLYGATSFSHGTVFEVANDANHTLTTLVTFDGTNGDYPEAGLIADASGNLYGTSSNNGLGSIFKVSAGTHELTTLITFDGTNGASPKGDLIADANGNLYGTTASGGAYGYGTVFELSPVPEPSALELTLTSCGVAMIASLGLRRRRQAGFVTTVPRRTKELQ